MAGRILTLQRQARELGRLRTGYTDCSGPKPRPVRSSTWIITSHAKHYLEAAAKVWGGQVEAWQPLGNGAQQYRVITEATCLDALLPPGDPLSQSYEYWTRGGAQRRCDGMTETITDQPCVCRAKWGDAFWETAPRDAACKITTRLNVILPEMPDIGAWRVETHSYYAANEMAAAVDVLKGSIGADALIPVRLRIEQRTRVANGQTKHFPVVAVELRGATAGQVLSGAVRVLATGAGVPVAAVGGSGEGQAAIEGPRPDPDTGGQDSEDLVAAAHGAATLDELREVWRRAQRAGVPLDDHDDPVAAAIAARRAELEAASEPPAAGGGPKAELWEQIVSAWPGTTPQLLEAFDREVGHGPEEASEEEMGRFLRRLQAGDAPGEEPEP